MGGDLLATFPMARETLEEIDDALGRNLTKLIASGPPEELTLTENAQPALMAISMAVLRVIETEGNIDLSDSCAFVAGHSLGEYSALAAARSLGLADTARLLNTRGQAMQKAVPVGEGGMAALLGAEMDVAQEIAERNRVLQTEPPAIEHGDRARPLLDRDQPEDRRRDAGEATGQVRHDDGRVSQG